MQNVLITAGLAYLLGAIAVIAHAFIRDVFKPPVDPDQWRKKIDEDPDNEAWWNDEAGPGTDIGGQEGTWTNKDPHQCNTDIWGRLTIFIYSVVVALVVGIKASSVK